MPPDDRTGHAQFRRPRVMLRRAAGGIRSVWRQPDQYEWITAFLRERELLVPAQLILATVAGSGALIPLTTILGKRRPGVGLVIVESAGCAVTLLMAAIWLWRWPSRRLSRAGVLAALGCIVGWSQVQPSAELGAAVATAAAFTGGYFAFLHSGKLMILNLVVALMLDVLTTVRLLRDNDVGTAVSVFWLVWFVNFSVPLTVRAMALTIRLYATRSCQDPLTGLLNRRAFFDTLTALVTDPDWAGTRIVVAMIDLDNFKKVNDTHGHAAGDRILQSVADILRNHAAPGSMICRAGGEEFLIAIADTGLEPEAMAAQLCAAIAELSPPVTASIGTATARACHSGSATLIDELIGVADEAMYAAKRLGGNSSHHAKHF